jgi:hypothetical protein
MSMDVEQLEARIKELEAKVSIFQDIEAIKKLQRAYGYYLEHWRVANIFGLFSKRPEVVVKVHSGEFRG